MKRFFIYLLLASCLLGAAKDVKITQRNDANTGFIERTITAGNNGLMGFDGSGHPLLIAAGTNITIVGGVISASGTSPGGVNGDLQYNNAGAFGGITPGTGVTTWITTPSSANLAAAVTGETGTGALVFGTSPSLTTPNIGAATGSLLTLTGGIILTSATISASNIDWTGSGTHTKTLGANTTFTFSNDTDGGRITVAITNTASNYTVTWPVGVLWSGGTAPTQTVGAKTDIYTFIRIGSVIYGSVVQNF